MSSKCNNALGYCLYSQNHYLNKLRESNLQKLINLSQIKCVLLCFNFIVITILPNLFFVNYLLVFVIIDFANILLLNII